MLKFTTIVYSAVWFSYSTKTTWELEGLNFVHRGISWTLGTAEAYQTEGQHLIKARLARSLLVCLQSMRLVKSLHLFPL